MKRNIALICIFLTSYLQAQQAEQIIANFFNQEFAKYDFTWEDTRNWTIESQATSKKTGITNYYVNQLYDGKYVFGAQSNFSIKNGKVFHYFDRFEKNISNRISQTVPTITVTQAVELAYQHAQLQAINTIEIIKTKIHHLFELSNGLELDYPVQARLGYEKLPTDALALAWEITFFSSNYQNLWLIKIDATSGEVLSQIDLVLRCDFGVNSNHQNHAHEGYFGKSFDASEALFANNSLGSYRVVPFNFESPNHSPRQLITNPHNILASPYGWHDTNGIPGPEFTITRGNNVWAREDFDGINSTIGASANGGSNLVFDFPYNPTLQAPAEYIDASVTNLFYMNNILHDVWYQYGFDEENGNFQALNYTFPLGGDNDPVIAESQDGSGTNNANFATPPDGNSPRMQMFLFGSTTSNNILNILSPSSIAGVQPGLESAFSPGFVALPQAPSGITGQLVLYQDTLGTQSLACTSPLNGSQIQGKICVIRRGDCNFTDKVFRAQTAGAIAVIIVNNVDGTISMGGSNASLTIPAISITQALGENIISTMATQTVTVTLSRPTQGPSSARDSSFDNGIVAHEYGHGISNRLTGGKTSANCLTIQEQMGEGWSDWITLMMQLKPGDNGIQQRGIGTFAVNQPTTGTGIRPFPYSTNTTTNPVTFQFTNSLSVPHGVGSVWASMLWDLTWAYIAKYGYHPDIYNGNGGNNKVMQLVLDGMKIQPCNPKFTDARDALIIADQVTTGGEDYCLIWQVFANRGLGQFASSGTNSASDQVEDFTVPPAGPNCNLSVANSLLQTLKVYPNPAATEIFITLPEYFGEIKIELFDLNGRMVLQQKVTSFQQQETLSVHHLQNGMYLIKIETNQETYTQKIIKK
ncbi:MAG: T9SS-dependent M36 family metallopeptidase [Flavobacterium sp.]